MYFPGTPQANGTYGITVAFSARPGVYPVTFTEGGLPDLAYSGANWSVTIGAATKSSLTPSIWFPEPNGTYTFSISPWPSNSTPPTDYAELCTGSVTVNGAPSHVNVLFAESTACEPSYEVIFTETGLPSVTDWDVRMAGVTSSSLEGTQISFSEVNGTYHYTINVIAGYYADPTSGNVTVSGHAVGVSIAFSQTPCCGGLAGASGNPVGAYVIAGIGALIAAVMILVVAYRMRKSPPILA